MNRTTRSTPRNTATLPNERPMRVRPTPKYGDVDYSTCETRLTEVADVVWLQHRLALSEAGLPVDDERYFALGIRVEDMHCPHVARLEDRFGHAKCLLCEVRLFCAAWVADGVFGDDTQNWANAEAGRMRDRLPVPRITIG